MNLIHPREGGPSRALRDTVDVGGLVLQCDTSSFIEWHVYFLGEYEPETTTLLTRVIRPGWTCVDAGANVGLLSLVMARAAGPSGRVHAFEALPTLSNRLEANVALNDLSNVRIHTICLGDRRGEVAFFTPRAGISNVGQSSLFLDRHQEGIEVVQHSVSMLPFDEFADREGLASWEFLKIDVEGAEIQVLKGAERSLKRWRPLILFEANARTQALARSSNAELLETLAAFGYRFHVHDKRLGWHPITGSEQRRVESDPDYLENVFATPGPMPDLA